MTLALIFMPNANFIVVQMNFKCSHLQLQLLTILVSSWRSFSAHHM